MIRKIGQFLHAIFMLLTFTASVLIAFPIFLLVNIGGNVASRKATWTIIHYWGLGWLWICGMPLKRLGKKPPPGRYVIVLNHISYLDALLIFPAMYNYFRPLAKKEMSKIPFMGFVYSRIALLVDRSSKHSRAKSMRLMHRTIENEADILIFPEGTFNETGAPLKEFYDGAFRLAINVQKPILPVLLPDTVNRWHFSAWWKTSPGKNRVVFLDPIPVEGLTIKDVPALKEKVYKIMEQELERLRNSV